MANKRIPKNWVPRTPAEAERFLWHVLHFVEIRELTSRSKRSSRIIKERIAQLQGEQNGR